MRLSLLSAALFALLLAACATSPKAPTRNVPQTGTLRVHPGLLGKPVPPELQAQGSPATPPAEAGAEAPASQNSK